MFADDTTVLHAGDETSPLITQDLKNMTKMFVSNKLTVNEDKCEEISFGCGKPDKVTMLSNEYYLIKSTTLLSNTLSKGM